MNKKLVALVVLLILVVLFTLQNTEAVSVQFFFWSASVSKALLIFILFGLGVLLGFFLGNHSRRIHKKEKETAGKGDRIRTP
ncbi:MAG: lipopolysaccharide assembly protein LapA domain-containing protein [Desulfovibrionales bacterium]